MGILDSLWHYFKMIVLVALGLAALWWAITNSAEVASFIVRIVDGIKTFFTTLLTGIF